MIAQQDLIVEKSERLECSYLGARCLVLRSETERQEGIGDSVRLLSAVVSRLAEACRPNKGKHTQRIAKPILKLLYKLSEKAIYLP